MAEFRTDAEIDISPMEYLDECSLSEKNELIRLLTKEMSILKFFPKIDSIQDELKLDILIKMFNKLTIEQLTELEKNFNF